MFCGISRCFRPPWIYDDRMKENEQSPVRVWKENCEWILLFIPCEYELFWVLLSAGYGKESIYQIKSCLSFTCNYTNSEKAMAPHSRTLAWKIPWTEEPGRLQSMGSLRVGHDWATSLYLFTFLHWRRKWQPTPVFLPGESQGQQSLVGCCLWGHTELDMTEVT